MVRVVGVGNVSLSISPTLFLFLTLTLCLSRSLSWMGLGFTDKVRAGWPEWARAHGGHDGRDRIVVASLRTRPEGVCEKERESERESEREKEQSLVTSQRTRIRFQPPKTRERVCACVGEG